MGSRLELSSSDPQFIVPSGKILVGSKSKHQLKVVFKPSNDGAASATITVRSNDPDSPEQTFRVAANGASLDPQGEEGGNGSRPGGVKELEPPPSEGGCSTAAAGGGSTSGFAALLVGLGLAVAARRRRGH
jgi:MYXO-CTERM domain-containing protein